MTELDTAPSDPQAYIAQVMAEIEEEVRVRRASGDIPPKLERELDELFLAHSPVAGRGGDLADALRMVDAATFIDPVVPIDSNRAAGAVVKKGMRTLLLWYVGWVTHQMSQFAAAVSRTLHAIDARIKDLERRVQIQHVPDDSVAEFPGLSVDGAWWVESAVAVISRAPGRVLHAACGDGWLVRRINGAGGDAYGVDPRPAIVERGILTGLDLREEAVADHLLAVAPAGLAGIVLSSAVEGLAPGAREHLLAQVTFRLAPGGTLLIHSVSRERWESADAPLEADLAAGHPLRAETWIHLLGQRGFEATAQHGPDGDYLLTAAWAHVTPLESTPNG